ncbi:hypothetical protein RND81_07G015700 [Saponaria officinalis]|uniref:PDZ domain-containing protein n=2 Tax=Saponaria officinalis TaxID=3572 RepID=A0AAW1JM05_SAPOF
MEQTMEKRQKTETPPVDVLSAIDHDNLKIIAVKRRYIDQPVDYNLDVGTKIAALKASPSVVSLISFSGESVLCQGSGFIIEAEERNNTVMTSLNLIRRPRDTKFGDNKLADNLKIVVCTTTENTYFGEIFKYDFHYNILIIKFTSNVFLQSFCLRMIDDDFGPKNSYELRPHTPKANPGDTVVAVGRYFCRPFNFMAASAFFSMDRCEYYDCGELLSIQCSITRCGEGGPLVNLFGEVIGITFYEIGHVTPVLPINIACKWWDHCKKYMELRHPCYGFEASSLYTTAAVDTLEKFINRFPSVSGGVLIEKVLPGSSAETAGLCENDIIIKCDGRTVKSFLELWNLLWIKVGDSVEFEVARIDLSTTQRINIKVGEAVPNELNSWPLYVIG